MAGAYYNEIDPFAAAWLRQLITAGLIADGEVDTRSITDVSPEDVRGFVQCHFFAGIGGWSYALRLAGWRDDRHVWTGSCPCQPFSSAGKGDGADDSRHLWPAWFRLIAECRPYVVFGEQVASADGRGWLDAVCHDLEACGYAVGPADLPAAGFGAFHIRHRLWFVADATSARHDRAIKRPEGQARDETRLLLPGASLEVNSLADTTRRDFRRHSREPRSQADARYSEARSADGHAAGSASSVGHASAPRLPRRECKEFPGAEQQQERRAVAEPSSSFWSDADWLYCRDGKHRPVEPGSFPLAHGIPARVGRLRGYGNAIVPQVAEAFIRAYCEARQVSR